MVQNTAGLARHTTNMDVNKLSHSWILIYITSALYVLSEKLNSKQPSSNSVQYCRVCVRTLLISAEQECSTSAIKSVNFQTYQALLRISAVLLYRFSARFTVNSTFDF
jgi:hypothetical protein